MMRLSEAISLGATLSRQAFGILMDPLTGDRCALGAAKHAVGADLDIYFSNIWPWMGYQECDCPECGWTPCDYQPIQVIGHLNDVHQWPREKIARFVANIEPPEQPQPEEMKEENRETIPA
jgi:hypothetical protein